MQRTPKTRLKWLAYAGAGMLLALVFLLYFHSQLVFDLASRIWSCF